MRLKSVAGERSLQMIQQICNKNEGGGLYQEGNQLGWVMLVGRPRDLVLQPAEIFLTESLR